MQAEVDLKPPSPQWHQDPMIMSAGWTGSNENKLPGSNLYVALPDITNDVPLFDPGEFSLDEPLLPASHDASVPSYFSMTQSTAPFYESRPYAQSRTNSSSSLPDQVNPTPPSSPGQEGIVHMLLSRGADVNIQNNRGQTPLHIAASRGDLSIVRLLLTSKFINVDAQDCCGATPLHLASENGHIEVVKLLVAHNAQLNVRASTA